MIRYFTRLSKPGFQTIPLDLYQTEKKEKLVVGIIPDECVHEMKLCWTGEISLLSTYRVI